MGTRSTRTRPAVGLAAIVGLAATLALTVPPAAAASPETRVVGGGPTTTTQYPWQVAVALNDARWQGTPYERQICGGSLLAPTIVVTAAHCVYDLPVAGGWNSPQEFEVFTGRTFLSESAGQVINVTGIYVPVIGSSRDKPEAAAVKGGGPAPGATPVYNPTTFEWDVALLKLAAPATSPAIAIAGPDETAVWAGGRPVEVSGWGSINPPHSAPVKPDQLQATPLGMVDDASCNGVRAPYFFPSVMVCAGVPSGGRGACYGDSGGPLVAPIEYGASTGYRLVGLTSLVGAAESCGAPYPDMYARLAGDAMRAFLQGAVTELAGVSPIGAGARPIEPPQTDIVKAKVRRKKLKFAFAASEPATFQCQLDRRAPAPCGPTARYRLRRGRHKLRVVAIDALGQADPTPAVKRWKVRRR